MRECRWNQLIGCRWLLHDLGLEKLRCEWSATLSRTESIHTDQLWFVSERDGCKAVSGDSAWHANYARLVQTRHGIPQAKDNYEFRFLESDGLCRSIELQFDAHVRAFVQRPIEWVLVRCRTSWSSIWRIKYSKRNQCKWRIALIRDELIQMEIYTIFSYRSAATVTSKWCCCRRLWINCSVLNFVRSASTSSRRKCFAPWKTSMPSNRINMPSTTWPWY